LPEKKPLDDNGIVVDIGRAHAALKAVAGAAQLRQLDKRPGAFAGANTRPSFWAQAHPRRLAAAARGPAELAS